MASACALAMFSGKNIYNFAILENLRIFQNCLFTGGVVTANGICSAAFCESAALRASTCSPERADFPRPGEDVTAGDKKGNLTREAWLRGQAASPSKLQNFPAQLLSVPCSAKLKTEQRPALRQA